MTQASTLSRRLAVGRRRTERGRQAVWFGAALAAFLAAAAPVRAEEPSALCERAIAHGAATAQVPADVLHAIALTETGRRTGTGLRPWPWAVNREGEGHWFETRDEALAFARQSVADGRLSFDLGCFQINYGWHGENFPSLDAMIDPMAGAEYAGAFLRDLHAEFGSWSAAAGAYHSRTPDLAARYRNRFDSIHASLGGGVAVAAAPPPKAPVRRVRGPKIINVDLAAFAAPAARTVELDAAAQGFVPAAGIYLD